MLTYSAYGLAIHSVVPLPGGKPLAKAKADAVIRIGRIDWSPSESSRSEPCIHFRPDEAYLYWQGLGKFLVRGGKEIIIEPSPGAARQLITLPLFGVVLAVLLHQRGLMVLHASAIAIDGQAVAFIAAKGHGKSTTAAMLYARGHHLLADDLVVLDFAEPQRPRVIPGFPQFKLWPESVLMLGDDPEDLPRLAPGQEKRVRRVTDRFSTQPLPLKYIYTLASGPSVELLPLQPREAMLQLITHIYISRFGKQLFQNERAHLHLHQCTDLVRSVPLYRLTRPASLTALSATADLVEAHLNTPDSADDVLVEHTARR